ncbi:4Fe-4S binding protein [Paucidesulfovibrio longus]|uniref:4Fe-4S binding protein n=1 Tax=Paucidesulfovibrio longus TaxID=889 RepID=UPI0003B66774|nr:4Fe-4S binding protein [Paucidesulfovibrio longus]
MSAVKDIFQSVKDLWSLFVGLKVTGKYFLQPTVTVHYPRQTVDPEVEQTFGGHVELVPKPKNPAKPKCIGCMMCVTNCPSGCLTVVKAKAPKPTPEEEQAMKEAEARGEEVKKPKAPKEPAKFLYDYSLCSLCGTCIENCPVGSLQYSHNIYFVGTSRKDFKLDLLKRLERQAENAAKASGTAPKAETAEAASKEA